MMTAFFFCFKDQSELWEGHERYYWKAEVSISVILHSIAEKAGIYQPAIIGIINWEKILTIDIFRVLINQFVHAFF